MKRLRVGVVKGFGVPGGEHWLHSAAWSTLPTPPPSSQSTLGFSQALRLMAGKAAVVAVLGIFLACCHGGNGSRGKSTSHDRQHENRKTSCMQMKDTYQVIPLKSWGSLPSDLRK